MAPSIINTGRVTAQLGPITMTLQGMAGGSKDVVPDTVGAQTTYGAGSSPPGVHFSVQSLALVAAAATIDLMALLGDLQDTIDGETMKLQALMIIGADSNGALTISEGAANGYEVFGAANPIVYPALCTLPWLMQFDDTLPDISASDCEIDLAGTGTDVFTIAMILG